LESIDLSDVALSFESTVSVPRDVLVSAVGSESVLLDLRSQAYYGLDEVGTRMWTALTAASSLQAGYEALLQEYEVEPARLRADIEEFVARMLRQGLLELRPR
jgi:hypothetical protein